jgi:8-amino-7-oxononanoate synthase
MGMTRCSAPRIYESPVGAEIVLNGRRYINFGGSSYLGLSSNPQILEAGIEALRECGSGGPVPSIHGVSTRFLLEVESEGRRFFGSEAAFYLNAGYSFGLAAIAAAREQFDAIFFDEFAHYSLVDGMAASGLPRYSFRHLDVENLELKLKQHLGRKERPLVVTDGLFSTRGEIAPLDQLSRAVSPYGGRLLVDESHSFGVLGASGRGALEHHHMDSALALVGGSLGKAFGTCGGIIPANEAEVASLRLTPVGLGASTGAPAAAAMCAASLRYVRQHNELLSRLRENIRYVKHGLRQLGLEIAGDDLAPIASFTSAPGKSMQALQEALLEEGIFVYHSTYLGAGDHGVIRCGVFADHGRNHLDALIQALRLLL